MGNYPEHLITQILQTGDDWDFELFCVRLYTEMEGYNYLPTSRTLDLGFDGRRVQFRKRGDSLIVSTLQKERLVEKAIRDVTNLAKGREKLAKVRVCYAFIRSNKVREDILRAVQKILPKACEVEVSGIVELVEEANRYSAALESTYAYELDITRRQLASIDREDQDVKRLGLRVLLAVQLDSNAQRLRDELLKGLVLQVTRRDRHLSVKDVARELSNTIGLNLVVDESYLEPTLRLLIDSGLLEYDGHGRYLRLGTAAEELDKTAAAAATSALHGYRAIRRSVNTFLQNPQFELSREDFQLFWQELQRGLIDLFRKYGIEFVDFVSAICASGSRSRNLAIPESILSGVHRIAQKVYDIDGWELPDQVVRRLVQGLPQILFDKASGAREWVAHLCTSYICACSLGLHPEAWRTLSRRLKTWDVIPDTHVILSVLGPGEDDHESMKELVKWWQDAGGVMAAAPPVRAEVIRHARLAKTILDHWSTAWHRHRGRRHPRIPQNNVFLRAAAARFGEDCGPGQAASYLSQFLVSGSDSSRLDRVLTADFRFMLAPTLDLDRKLTSKLLARISDHRMLKVYPSEIAKEHAELQCKSDAEVLAYLGKYRGTCLKEDRHAILLTQAHCLGKVHQEFTKELGYQSITIDPARLLFAVALTPGAGFTIRSVEAVLFGHSFQREVRRNEDLAKKVSQDFDSSRGPAYIATMEEKLNERLSGP
jgi:hypothetical protein